MTDHVTTSTASTTPARRTPFLPLHGRLLLRRIDTPTTHPYAMPDSIKEKPTVCEVVAVSLGQLLDSGRLIPSLLAPGDRILVGKYAGNEHRIDGEDLVTVREEEVLGILTPVPAERIANWLGFHGSLYGPPTLDSLSTPDSPSTLDSPPTLRSLHHKDTK